MNKLAVRPRAASLLPALVIGLVVALGALPACRVQHTASVRSFSYDTGYAGPRSELTVGRFSNNSSYLRGVFTGPDRLGLQARALLRDHLERTNRFVLLEPELTTERGLVVTGQVSELGPERPASTGATESTESQTHDTVRASVTLNVVDLATSRVVYSVGGEGQQALTADESATFRSSAGLDEAVTARVLDLALGEAVGHLVEGLERGDWLP